MDYYQKNKTTDGQYIISSTGMGYLEKSPLHFKAFAEGQITFDSPAMAFGRAIHEALLEPGKFFQNYAEKPDLRTKAGKEAFAALQDEGKTILKKAEFEQMKGIMASLSADETVMELLAGSTTEQEFFTTVGGCPAKAKIDIVKARTKGAILIDLKTTRDAQPSSFIRKSKYSFKYHRQAAWYKAVYEAATGMEVERFYFLAIEKEPPYAFSVIELDETALQAGWHECEALLDVYRDKVNQGLFPGYGHHIWKEQVETDAGSEAVMNLADFMATFASHPDEVYLKRLEALKQAMHKDPEKVAALQLKPAYFGPYYSEALQIQNIYTDAH